MDEATKAEFARVQDENARQNKRIEKLEENFDIVRELTLSVQKLALNMESMLNEQKELNGRVKVLESEPANKWNNLERLLFDAVIGTLAAAIATGIINMI